MKPSTKELKALLEDEITNDAIINLVNSQQGVEIEECNIEEAVDGYTSIRDLILETINKGIYDQISSTRRKQTLQHVKAITTHRANAPQFIKSYLGLEDQIQLTNLWQRNSEGLNTTVVLKDVMELQRKMLGLEEDLRVSKEHKDQIIGIKGEAMENISDQKKILEEAKKLDEELETVQEKTNISYTRVSENAQEVANTTKKILAFNNNIEENEKKLHEIFDTLRTKIGEEITKQTEKAAALIEEAENALELKSTQGISRAYSSRLDKLNNDNSKGLWIFGAVFFLLLSLVLGLMLTGLTIGALSFPNTENPAVIFGRIAMTGIGITAAVFCAKRYLYIKHLEEDYEYKVVLTKSILAFAGKLKEIDDTRVAEYLNRVLIDLHQDPSRKKIDEEIIDQKLMKSFEKIIKKVNKV